MTDLKSLDKRIDLLEEENYNIRLEIVQQKKI